MEPQLAPHQPKKDISRPTDSKRLDTVDNRPDCRHGEGQSALVDLVLGCGKDLSTEPVKRRPTHLAQVVTKTTDPPLDGAPRLVNDLRPDVSQTRGPSPGGGTAPVQLNYPHQPISLLSFVFLGGLASPDLQGWSFRRLHRNSQRDQTDHP